MVLFVVQAGEWQHPYAVRIVCVSVYTTPLFCFDLFCSVLCGCAMDNTMTVCSFFLVLGVVVLMIDELMYLFLFFPVTLFIGRKIIFFRKTMQKQDTERNGTEERDDGYTHSLLFELRIIGCNADNTVIILVYTIILCRLFVGCKHNTFIMYGCVASFFCEQTVTRANGTEEEKGLNKNSDRQSQERGAVQYSTAIN